jgi:hypothetical protein
MGKGAQQVPPLRFHGTPGQVAPVGITKCRAAHISAAVTGNGAEPITPRSAWMTKCRVARHLGIRVAGWGNCIPPPLR